MRATTGQIFPNIHGRLFLRARQCQQGLLPRSYEPARCSRPSLPRIGQSCYGGSWRAPQIESVQYTTICTGCTPWLDAPSKGTRKKRLQSFSDFAHLAKLVAGVLVHSNHYAADRPWQDARRYFQECAAYAEELPGALRRMPKFTLARRWLSPLTRRSYGWQASRSTLNRNSRPASRMAAQGKGIRGSGPLPRNPFVQQQPRTDRGSGEGEGSGLGL